jgi:type IV secretion system protein VirB1
MQVSSKNFATVGLRPETAFDPCTNIAAGAALLTLKYQQASAAYGPGRQARGAALSMYNTGNAQAGFRNGYVHRILQAPCW